MIDNVYNRKPLIWGPQLRYKSMEIADSYNSSAHSKNLDELNLLVFILSLFLGYYYNPFLIFAWPLIMAACRCASYAIEIVNKLVLLVDTLNEFKAENIKQELQKVKSVKKSIARIEVNFDMLKKDLTKEISSRLSSAITMQDIRLEVSMKGLQNKLEKVIGPIASSISELNLKVEMITKEQERSSKMLDTKLETITKELERSIKVLDTNLDTRINSHESQMQTRISSLERQMQIKLSALEVVMHEKFDSIEKKLDMVWTCQKSIQNQLIDYLIKNK